MHRQLIALTLLILISIVVLGFSVKVTLYEEANTIGENLNTFQELKDRFTQLSDKKGAVYTYEVLKRAVLPPGTDLHLLGHVVGDELYKQQGIIGLEKCTADFRNACSHTIVIGALDEFGENAMSLIRDACKNSPGGSGAYTMCFHGLGHGVFAGYGYNIQKTVEFCKLTGTSEYGYREYDECFGGAIMELTGGGGHDPELWNVARDKYFSKPLAPCIGDEVPDDLKEICLMYLTPQIWKLAGIDLGNPDPSKFKNAFEYCSKIPNSSLALKDSCYGGFGKEFVPIVIARDIRNINNITDEQLGVIYDWCSKADEKNGVKACTLSALDSLFWGGENDSMLAFRYCSLVTNLDKEIGESCFFSLSNQINKYIEEGHRRSLLCSELPKEVRSTCQENKDKKFQNGY